MSRRRRRCHAYEIAAYRQLSPPRQVRFLDWLRRVLAAWLGQPGRRTRTRPKLRVLR